MKGGCQAAAPKHRGRNDYYRTNDSSKVRVTNAPERGWVAFDGEGTVLTDDLDTHTVGSDLTVKLTKETCDWLTQPAVAWLDLSVRRAVEAEFDRYIAAGDLGRTLERLAREQADSDAAGGFLGMNL